MIRSRWSIIFIIFMVVMPMAAASSIDFRINGASPVVPITLTPGTQATIETEMLPNTYIQRIEVETSDKVLQQFIEQELANAFVGEDRTNVTLVSETVVDLPETLPGGKHKVYVQYYYSDKNYDDRVDEILVHVEIPEGNKMISALTRTLPDDVAYELVDLFKPATLEPLPREPTREELRKLLGVESENVKTTKIREEVKDDELTQEDIDRINENRNEDLRKVMKYVQEKIKPKITKELHVYEVEREDGTIQHLSKVIIKISHTDALNDVEIVEEIPKTVAADASDLSLDARPDILVADPIVKWQFDHIPEGQTKEFSYAIDKELETIESKTAAAGKEPSGFAKWLANLLQKFIGGDE